MFVMFARQKKKEKGTCRINLETNSTETAEKKKKKMNPDWLAIAALLIKMC